MDASALTVVLVVTAIYAGFLVAVTRKTHRELQAALPRGVLDHFATHPGQPLDMDIRVSGFVWNPGAPLGPRNLFYGPGHARFSQDPDGLIRLDWTPRWGPERHVSGPPPVLPDEHRVPIRHTAKIVGVLLGVYLTILGGWWALSSR